MSKESTEKLGGLSVRPGGFGRGKGPVNLQPVVKAKDTKGTLKRIWRYMMFQRAKLVAVFLMVIVSAMMSLAGPYLIGISIDQFIKTKDFRGLVFISLLLGGVYVINSISAWLESYWMIEVAEKTVKKIREDLFSKIQLLPLKYFDSRPHGELMSRLTNDVETITSTLSSSTTQVFSSVIVLTGTIFIMVWLSPLLTVISLVIAPLMGFTSKQITKHTRKYFSEQQAHLGALNGIIEESISGQKVVKTFAQEAEVMNKFSEANYKLRHSAIRAQMFTGLIFPMMNVLNNISFGIVAGAGGWLVVREIITVGTIATFINYTKQFTRPLNDLANQFNMVLSAIAGAERVFEVIDEEIEPKDVKNAIELEDIQGKVLFDHVYFSYNKDTPILKNINLSVDPGQMIALVGPTGAGKTTIINLLTRFYDIDEGAIWIDGYDIREIKRDSLRTALGIVLQDTYLFNESVGDNIRYGNLSATDTEVEEAARLANAHSFIKRLPKGYDTILGEDGGDLSQGQRQLLAIARTILANPSILILDEATSSVDTRTEIHIQEAMLNLMKGRTSFVIAHRLSTIQNADKIVVINSGEIIEMGHHRELLDKHGFYFDLYQTQFNQMASMHEMQG
jgi:ATP-binding cassette subfamily B protein